VVFLWAPPHFWALALLIRDGYAKAKVPMLPVVCGKQTTVRKILGYSLLLVATSAAPFVFHTLGAAYLLSALVLGGVLLTLALRLRLQCSRRNATLLFHYSLLYLALLFLAMAADAVLSC